MISSSLAHEPQERQRAEVRTNMFVMASLSTDRMSGAVRIRNLSPRGALIEGRELPDMDERFRMRRGDISVTGKVVRRQGKQAGLNFDFPTTPTDWMHVSKTVQQVESIISERPERYPLARPAAPLPHSAITRDDLLSLADMVEALGNSMSEDPVIIERYLTKLQVLDVTSQKLRQLAQRL